MRHVIRPGTTSIIIRHVGQRGRGRHHRKRVVFATLLTIAVGVQLVTVGRYTISLMFTPGNIEPETVSFADGYSTALSYADSITHDDRMDPIFSLTTDDASAAERALRIVANRTCFVEGLDDRNDSRAPAGSGCLCKDDWYGAACSVPGFINRSPTPWSKDSLRLRSHPRRIVNAFPFSIEFDMVELRFAELAEVVDVFLILESNYTAYGDPKPLHFLDRLRNGTYASVAAKVVHVFLDYFPAGARRNGWLADALHRNHLGTHGLRRLGGLRLDDLLVLTDADELPRRQLLSFLKWHDGYSEPVAITYQWSVYGFFWGIPAPKGVMKTQEIQSIITIAMAVYVFRYQLYSIRTAHHFIYKHPFDVEVRNSTGTECL